MKRMNKKGTLNKKGFTLIELLAVIVILAILVLVALPAVTGMMNNATRNAFVTDVQSMITNMKTAYVQETMSGGSQIRNFNITGTTISESDSGSPYYYKCLKIGELVEKGYMEKSDIGNYNGYIEVFAPTNNSATIYVAKVGKESSNLSIFETSEGVIATNIKNYNANFTPNGPKIECPTY